MATTAALTKNSRQGINFQIPHCIGLAACLSPNPRWGYRHAYDETPVGLVVYVRNDPVNKIDPDGKEWNCLFGDCMWYRTEPEGIHQPTRQDVGEDRPDLIGSGGYFPLPIRVPNINTTLPSWWNRGRINNSITVQMRVGILESSVTAAGERIKDLDCSQFVAQMLVLLCHKRWTFASDL
jgi:hypothetical protein